jgi:Ca2+-binding RTX toxin-like protein
MAIINGTNGNDTRNGTNEDDEINGLGGNDTLYGLDGNDVLDGGEGIDRLEGGNGSDYYVVDNPSDVIVENGTGIADKDVLVVFSASGNWTLGSTLEDLILRGSSAINGTGNSLNNAIYGNDANNVLYGKAGNDTLVGLGGDDILLGGIGNDTLSGGSGSDTLRGGVGADYFYFYQNIGVDTIVDFSVAYDTIGVSRNSFRNVGLTAGAAITADQFRIGASAADASDRFIYNSSTGGLFFDADGTGGTAQVQLATLSAGLAMTNADIFVIP